MPDCQMVHRATGMKSTVNTSDNSQLNSKWSGDMVFYYANMIIDRYVNPDLTIGLYRDDQNFGPKDQSPEVMCFPFNYENDWHLALSFKHSSHLVLIDCSPSRETEFPINTVLALEKFIIFAQQKLRQSSLSRPFRVAKLFLETSPVQAINCLSVIYAFCCTRNIMDFLNGAQTKYNRFDVSLFFNQEFKSLDRDMITKRNLLGRGLFDKAISRVDQPPKAEESKEKPSPKEKLPSNATGDVKSDNVGKDEKMPVVKKEVTPQNKTKENTPSSAKGTAMGNGSGPSTASVPLSGSAKGGFEQEKKALSETSRNEVTGKPINTMDKSGDKSAEKPIEKPTEKSEMPSEKSTEKSEKPIEKSAQASPQPIEKPISKPVSKPISSTATTPQAVKTPPKQVEKPPLSTTPPTKPSPKIADSEKPPLATPKPSPKPQTAASKPTVKPSAQTPSLPSKPKSSAPPIETSSTQKPEKKRKKKVKEESNKKPKPLSKSPDLALLKPDVAKVYLENVHDDLNDFPDNIDSIDAVIEMIESWYQDQNKDLKKFPILLRELTISYSQKGKGVIFDKEEFEELLSIENESRNQIFPVTYNNTSVFLINFKSAPNGDTVVNFIEITKKTNIKDLYRSEIVKQLVQAYGFYYHRKIVQVNGVRYQKMADLTVKNMIVGLLYFMHRFLTTGNFDLKVDPTQDEILAYGLLLESLLKASIIDHRVLMRENLNKMAKLLKF